MLVDDDLATNFIHSRLIKLSHIDAHVEVCDSARKALDYLKCEGQYSTNTMVPQPGIIFLDINMPGLSGWDFLEEYKNFADYRQGKTVVTMLTTSFNPDDKIRGEENPFVNGFINKPLSQEVLHNIVDFHFPRAAS